MKGNKYFVVLALSLVYINVQSQGVRQYSLVIEPADISSKAFSKIVKYKESFRDSSAITRELNDILLQLYSQSYLSATFDSIFFDSTGCNATLTVGKPYRWIRLYEGNVDEEILSKTGFRDKFFNQSAFNYKQLSRLFERIIRLYENNGYPFAMVKLDSVELSGNGLSAKLKLEKYKLVYIDSVNIYGKPKIAPSYLYNYLGVKKGDLYNEDVIKKIGVRIKELPFLAEIKPYNVAFTETNTILNLYLEKKNANRFDGIVGVLPNEEDAKIELTGDVKLRLQNSFRRGELINFNWRKLVNKSQDLKFKFNYPYLFNTPFGVDFDFKLYRRDTLFIDIYTKYGVQYSWKANNYFGVFINHKNSSLLSTVPYRNLTTLPRFADVRSVLYGVETNFEKLNYRLNPKKGYSAFFSIETGSKQIKKNSDLNPLVYDDLKLNTNLYNFLCDVDYYFPLTKNMVINIGNQSGYTFNENIFENELFRIGGLMILRGFDEESIPVSLYTVNTLEYRVLLEQNSYWYLFFDGAYYENDNVNLDKKITDTPIGFGTGINFQTNAGIFSLNYALGKQFNNPIVLRAAKIHFGFVNYF